MLTTNNNNNLNFQYEDDDEAEKQIEAERIWSEENKILGGLQQLFDHHDPFLREFAAKKFRQAVVEFGRMYFIAFTINSSIFLSFL